MPVLLTCPEGHQWQLMDGVPTRLPRGQVVCPICQLKVDLPDSDSGRWVVTDSGSVMLADNDPETVEIRAGSEATPMVIPMSVKLPAEQVVVPGYEILAEVGRGGMGVIYKARHLKLKRLAALKMILSGSHAGEQQLARFHAEAEAVARLQHPNIVQIYEIGDQEGRPFLALEYVEGGSLSQQTKGRAQSVRDSAQLVATLAHAIHFAHEHGIVHRDLKPANILLASSDRKAQVIDFDAALATTGALQATLAEFTPKVTDFGLAKRLDDTGSNTQTGTIIGTANYMAPEQAWGKPKEVGPSADIYSLGAILYEMLTGKPPFVGESQMDTMLRVMAEDPVPPSRIRADIPRDLETICLKCLCKRPAQRYPTALALAEDLQRFLNGNPIVARRVSIFGRGFRWVIHHPAVTGFVAVFLIGLLALGGVGVVQRRHNATVRRHAVEVAPRAQEILHRYCYECHGLVPAKAERKLNVLDHALLLDEKRKMVIPGMPDDSRLIHRIVDESMPPQEAEEMPRVSQEELAVLKEWIAGGAPSFPERDLELPPDPVGDLAMMARDAKEVFREHCYSCHRFGKADGGIKIFNHDLLVTKRKVVVPFQPEHSELYELMVARDERIMPPVKIKTRPTPEQIDMVFRWIAAGAPALPRTKDSE